MSDEITKDVFFPKVPKSVAEDVGYWPRAIIGIRSDQRCGGRPKLVPNQIKLHLSYNFCPYSLVNRSVRNVIENI